MNKIIQFAWVLVRPFYRIAVRLFRPITLGCRALVFDEAGRVLLVRHSYTPGWYFPGGGVSPGETSLAGIRRELDEEVGVLLKAEPKLLGLFANFTEFRSDHVAFYMIEAGQYDLVDRKSFEIAEYDFFPLDGLPAGITWATQARLDEFQQDAPAPPLW